MQFEITQLKPGTLETNIASYRESLEADIAKYRGIVVTEDNLPFCKDVNKELSRKSKELDTFRKDVKRQFSEPIREFDARCKELQELISEVSDPINEGISEINAKAKAEKLEFAKSLAAETAEKMGFKDVEKLDIKPVFGNVSTTHKDIQQDITEQIILIQEQEKAEQKRREVFETLIQIENENLNLKMSLDDFAPYMDEADTAVIKRIKEHARIVSETEKNARREFDKDSEENCSETTPYDDNSYLIRIYDSRDTADDVIGILKLNGYMALVE